MMPAAMIAATACTACPHVGEGRQHHLGVDGLRQQFHGHLRDHPEQSLRPGHEGHEIEPGRIKRLAAEAEDLAVQGDQLQLLDVVHRQSVLEAVHPAGVLSDIAADAARDLRRGIGSIEKAIGRGRLRNRQVADAGLHPGHPCIGVDLQDAIEPRQAQQHAPGKGQGAA